MIVCSSCITNATRYPAKTSRSRSLWRKIQLSMSRFLRLYPKNVKSGMPRHFSRTWCLRWCHLKLAINPSFACSMWIVEILGLTWDYVDISPKSIAAGTASIMIEKELQRVDKTAMKSLEQKDVLFLYPQSSKRNTSMLVLKKPKTESSIRRVFIPATVAHQLKAWKREQERAKEALGGWVHRLQPDPRQWSGSSDGTDAHHCTFERVKKSLIPKKQLFPASICRCWRKSPRTRTC